MSRRPDDYDEIVCEDQQEVRGRHPSRQRVRDRRSHLDWDLSGVGLAMGGGIPIGRWTRFYGGYHSTKTLSLRSTHPRGSGHGPAVRLLQRREAVRPDFARDKIGVNTDELTLVEGATIEEIGEKMEAMMTSAMSTSSTRAPSPSQRTS
jgi:hypothetical protein